MDFSRLSSPSLRELFVKEIENRILSGNLSIGDQLPTERELAEKMGVSRSVVNSGLSDLAAKGFIEMKPRIGAFVADFKRKGTVETLLAILRYNGGVMKNTEMKSLLEVRLAFETLAIQLATPRMTKESLEALKKLLVQFGESDTASESARLIFLFHHEICIISGNTFLPVIFFSFKELSLRLWERYFARHGNQALYQNTLRLFKCFEKRNTKEALWTFQSSLQKTISGDVSIYQESQS